MADKEITIKVTTEADASQVDDLKTKVDELSTSADNASNAIDNATSSTDQLSTSTESINGDGLASASEDADTLSNSTSSADDEVNKLNNDLSIIEGAALLGVAEQMSSLGSQAENMAQGMNTAAITVGQLATQTGVAEPQMVSLINHISNATFPNDEAMMYVKSLDQIGVSSDNLGQSATDLDKINDAFGLGANKVNSLGQELSVLGVDMNNVSSSFNALAYANANTVGGMDNYYNFLRKYDAEFNELGFNVDQASVIIAGATQKFGGGRAALTGLSTALKESNGDVRALEQSLGLQAGSISNATALTGQYEGQLQTLANEEAEHKTWLDQIGAAWEDMSLSLSPILSPLSSFLGLIGQAGSFAVGINGIVTLAGSLRTLQLAQIASTIATNAGAAAQWLLNVAMSANPIMIVVLAIVALIAVLGYLYFNNEQVRNAINALGQTFVMVGQIMYTSIINGVNMIISSLQGLWNYVVTLGGLLPANVNITGNQIINTIIRVVTFFLTLPLQIGMIFTNIIAKTLGFGNNFVQRMISAGSRSVSNFMNYITTLPGRLSTELQNMLSAVGQWAATLPQKFWDAGVNAVKNFLSALGIHSPGTMQRMLVWEVNEMGRRVPVESRGLLSNISQLGTDVVDEFGNPTLGLNYNDTANAKLVANMENTGNGNPQGFRDLILNIESVDSEERINQIIDRITRVLAFDNETAGRTT